MGAVHLLLELLRGWWRCVCVWGGRESTLSVKVTMEGHTAFVTDGFFYRVSSMLVMGEPQTLQRCRFDKRSKVWLIKLEAYLNPFMV